MKAGTKLYADEQDYTGLSALDPDDPHTIYVSTFYDPRDDTTKSTKREIWRGTTCDNGATFTWTPVDRALDDGQHPPDRSEVGREPHGAALAARDVHDRAELRDEGRRALGPRSPDTPRARQFTPRKRLNDRESALDAEARRSVLMPANASFDPEKPRKKRYQQSISISLYTDIETVSVRASLVAEMIFIKIGLLGRTT